METQSLHTLFKKMSRRNVKGTLKKAYNMEGVYVGHLPFVVAYEPFQSLTTLPVLLLSDAEASQVVLIAIDLNQTSLNELADEDPFLGEFPLYFTENSHRKSPVYYLMNVADALRQFFDEKQGTKNPEILSVLVTSSNIINYDDMAEVWESADIKVLDKVKVSPKQHIIQVLLEEQPLDSVFGEFFQRFSKPDGFHWLLLKDTQDNLWHNDADDDENSETTDDEQVDDDAAAVDEDDVDTDDEDEDEDLSFDRDLFNWIDGPDSNNKQTDEKSQEGKGKVAKDANGEEIWQPTLPDFSELKVDVLYPYKDPDKQIRRLIGLDDLREFIEKLSSLSEFHRRLAQVRPQAHVKPVSLHSIFVGPVGSGKTTAARLMGSQFLKSGVLSKGHVVVCGMPSFTGCNFGSEEENVRQIMELAQGGVLFIDEAYQLEARHPHDPLHKVLPLMLNMLADESNRDIAVILAGYENVMDNLLSANQGLRSRFPHRFVFKEFTYDNLLAIIRKRVAEDGFSFTREGWKKVCSIIRKDYDARDKAWGNGRYISNLLDYVYLVHAQRCVRQKCNDAQLLRITAADIKEQPSNTPPRKSIGF